MFNEIQLLVIKECLEVMLVTNQDVDFGKDTPEETADFRNVINECLEIIAEEID